MKRGAGKRGALSGFIKPVARAAAIATGRFRSPVLPEIPSLLLVHGITLCYNDDIVNGAAERLWR